MAITVVVYWVGLSGPLLLDDHYNLEVLQRWLIGKATLQTVLFDGRSGMFGRPLAMASLALSAGIGGYTPFAFKLGNLLVHLLTGGVVFALIQRIATRDPHMAGRAGTIAIVVATLWLLHPLNASTVLYAIQRMAQLSVLCMLAGMWLYLAMRDRITARSDDRAAVATLFIGIPLLLMAGFLSKENALLLPALCLVLELGCYRDTSRPPAIKVFFGTYLALPFLLGIALLANNPARITSGYMVRDFDWQQRLLTQGRALCDYLWKILVPNPPSMGVYTDDYALSTGLLSPSSTLVALLVLAGVTLTAWHLRKRVPALFVGWGIFLVGHAIESSVLPLELYFEHRNYLPMVGVLYAAAGLAMAGGDAMRKAGLRPDRIGAALAVGVVALLVFGAHGRARVWSSPETLAVSAVTSHPQSLRANMALVRVALQQNNREAVTPALDRLIAASNPRTRAMGYFNRLYLACALDREGSPDDLRQAVAEMPPRVIYADAEFFGLLLDNTRQGCGAVTDRMLGDALDTLLDRATAQPDGEWVKWRLRNMAARFYSRSGDWQRTREQALLAWQPGTDPAAAELLVRAQLQTGDIVGAERTWEEASRRAKPVDQAGLLWLRRQIDIAHKQPKSNAASP
jgi:protein O-mannosyl-transferase